MLNKQLDDLEAQINIIEERIEEDDDFVDSDEFQPIYKTLIETYTQIKDFGIDAFPYGELGEKAEIEFHKQKKRFKKLETRINSIKDDSEIEGYMSPDWMFANDGDEED